MDDGMSEPKRCETCGDPIRTDNTLGICNDTSKPECDKECRRRQRARNPRKTPPRPRLACCEICETPLNGNNRSGLCSGKNSPACKRERLRRWHERKASEVKADPRADAPTCDVCGGKLNRNNTMGVCGDPWKPECRRERKRRKELGMIPGPKGPAITEGDVFGRWTALETSRIETAFVWCRCACGSPERRVLGRNLVLRLSRDCGCRYMKEAARRRFPDPYLRAGDVFGRLTLLEDVWRAHDGALCRCACGRAEVAITSPERLKAGRTKSCGCLKREGQRTHGLSKHPLYSNWCSMMNRCTNPKDPSYKHYGGRAAYGARPIKVCDRWLDVRLFIEDIMRDIGPRPPGRYESGLPLYTLDRLDPDGDYEPGKVKWSTQSEQALNQRNISDLTRKWRDAEDERDAAIAGQDALAAEVDRLTALLAARARPASTRERAEMDPLF